jgi:hypothetical protein
MAFEKLLALTDFVAQPRRGEMFIVTRKKSVQAPSGATSTRVDVAPLGLKTKLAHVAIKISPLRGSRNSHNHKIRLRQ